MSIKAAYIRARNFLSIDLDPVSNAIVIENRARLYLTGCHSLKELRLFQEELVTAEEDWFRDFLRRKGIVLVEVQQQHETRSIEPTAAARGPSLDSTGCPG